MVASDGRRLSCAKRTNSEPKEDINGKIIPPKILNILKKLLPCEGNVKIAIGEKNIFFKFGLYKFSSNLIEGKFPNYQKVIPETQEFRIILKKKELEEAVKRISLVVEQKSRRIYMTVDQNLSEIFSDESDLGMEKEEMNCVYEGPKATIAFNYNYLLDPIRDLKEEEVAVEFTNPEKTITLRSVPDNESVHIIMPMQKQKKDE
jgi:DNA polymerase III subunit beta